MGDTISTYLFTQGVLGVAVVVLGWVAIKLYNEVRRLYARIEELQEMRLQDSKEVSKDIADVLRGNSEANRILAEKIEVAKSQGRPQ